MFTGFDAVCTILLLATMYLGYVTGFLGSLIYLFSGFAGMWVANAYAARWGAPYLLVFIGVTVLVILLGVLMRHILSALLLGWLDRAAGAFLGALLGILIIANALSLSGDLKHNPEWHLAVLNSFTHKQLIRPWKALVPPFDELRRMSDQKYLSGAIKGAGFNVGALTGKIAKSEERMRQEIGSLSASTARALHTDKKKAKKE